MCVFEKIDKWLIKILTFMVVSSFVLLVILVSMQVFIRFFTKSSLTWSEELSTFIMVWMVLFASVLVTRNHGHIWVENFMEKITGSTRYLFLGIGNVLVAVFLLIIIWGSFILLPTVHSQIAPATKICMSYIYLAVPLSMGLSLIYVIADIIREFTRFLKEE